MKLKHIMKPATLYALIALAVLGPTISRGYTFLLDIPWPVRFQLSDYTYSGIEPQFVYYITLSVLNIFLPAWVLQKLMLLVVLAGAGISTHKMSGHMYRKYLRFNKTQTTWASILSGVIAMLNPFVFERLAAGQWIVLAGYAYTPLVVYIYLKYKNTKPFWITYAIFPLVSIHFWLLVSIFGVISFALFRRRSFYELLRPARSYIWFFAVNAFWILPLFTGGNAQAENLNRSHFAAFQTLSDPNVGILGNVVSLHGMWASHSSLLKDTNQFWFAYALCLLAATLWGMHQYRRNNHFGTVNKASVMTLAGAILLAIGVAHPLTQAILTPFSYLPLAATLRESAKAIGIITIVYALWAPVGIVALATKLWSSQALKSALVLHILMMSGMLWGLNGTINNHDYPNSWYDVVSTVPTDSKALVLPWQGYMELEFADNVYAANPARVFFPFGVVQSNSTGNQLIDNRDRELLTLLNTYLDKEIDYQTLVDTLVREQGITHIIILKTGNWQRYQPLITEAIALKANVQNLSEITRIAFQ